MNNKLGANITLGGAWLPRSPFPMLVNESTYTQGPWFNRKFVCLPRVLKHILCRTISKNSSPYSTASAEEWTDSTHKSKLTTNHIRVCWIPAIITHGPPLSTPVDLQSTRCVGGASRCPPYKPQVTTSLTCGGNTVAWEQDNYSTL